MDLRMARGEEALALPDDRRAELRELATEADAAVNRDQELAAALSRRELDLYRAVEVETGYRAHKGHALHNLGAAILGDDPEEARTLFHAAFIEDARTDPREPPDLGRSIARQTLAEMFGEPTPLLARLVRQARDTTGDPVELAREIEAVEAPLPSYGGFRRRWRTLDQLDGIPPSSLVFVAGAHALPDRMLALRKAVNDAGLQPVVVIEFEDFDPNDFVKSETLMRRCGAVVFDVSFSSSAYILELMLAKQLDLPRWAGFVAWSAGDSPHAWDMTEGLMEVMALSPVGVTDDEQLRRQAEAWLRGQPGLTPARPNDPGIAAKFGPPGAFEPHPTAAGTAYAGPLANSSNTNYARFLPGQPQAVPSGWGGAPEAPFDPALHVPRYKLVDGKLVREVDPPDDRITRVDLREPKE